LRFAAFAAGLSFDLVRAAHQSAAGAAGQSPFF